MTPSEFIQQYAPYAQRVSRLTGIDPRIVLAQAALETGYGKSAPNFNIFGIKGKGSTQQTKEFVDGQMVSMPQEFRAYGSPEESFADYAKLMQGERYAGVRSGQTLEEQIAALQQSGYATDPNYGAKIRQIASGINLEGLPTGNARLSTRETSQMDQMQQPQQPMGFMDRLRDPRTRLALSALSRSSVGQRLGEIAAADLARQQGLEDEQRKLGQAAEQRNRTAQWLAAQPNGQKYAALVLNGTLSGSEAYNAWKQEGAGVSGVKVGDKLVNPKTGEIIFEDAAAAEELTNEQVGVVRNLSNDLLKTYKIYDEVANGYGLISSAIKNGHGVDDYVMTVAFAKILDPESVVRESEQAAVARAGGAIDAFVKQVQNFISGTGNLPEETKQRIFSTAKERAGFYFNKAQQEHARAITIAKSAGIPTDLIDKVIPKPTPMPAIEPIAATDANQDTRTQTAKDAGISIEMWNDMLPEEKRPFM